MPWTLYRYIVKELLKLMLAAAAVLVLVISFAASIKPMTEGLLGPEAMFKFLLFTAPTMLVYVLPFAAAFASTLVFLRMTNDNEIVACSASGMSYGQVLMPVMILGLALMMTLFGLSNFVIPQFNKAAAQTIERDLMSMLVSRLNTGQPFELDNAILYADHAIARDDPHVPDAEIQPERVVELYGVVVGQTDREGLIRGDATAEVATAALYRDQGQSWVTIRLRDVMFYHPHRGQLLYQQLLDWPAVRLPNFFKDKPKFLSWPELKRLVLEPERNAEVRDAKIDLARSIAAMNLAARLRPSEDDRAGDELSFTGGPSGSSYRMRAPHVEARGDRLDLHALDDQRVVVELFSEALVNRRYEAESAIVNVEGGDDPMRPVVDIELLNVEVQDLKPGGLSSARESVTLPRLMPREPMLERPVEAMPVVEIAELAATPPYNASPDVVVKAGGLRDQLAELNRRIIGRLHERTASSVSCLLLLLMGAVISMLCRGSLPLVVFFWSFGLAIVSIVILNSGQNMAKDFDVPIAASLCLLWFGNVLLALVLGGAYCKLAKH